jgi:hypothetical protein
MAHADVRTQLILNVDDDVLLDEEDIMVLIAPWSSYFLLFNFSTAHGWFSQLGWQLSRTYPDRLVGYSARLHVPIGDGILLTTPPPGVTRAC